MTKHAPGWGRQNCRSTASVDAVPSVETLLTATDLVCWAKLIGFIDTPMLAHAEIATFRNLVLHVAARITRGARQVRVRIGRTWKYDDAIAESWLRIRAAFT